MRLGREGYTKVQQAAYRVAQYIAREIEPLGPYEFICAGEEKGGIPAVCFRIREGEDPGYSLYDLSERLASDRMAGSRFRSFGQGVGYHCHARHVPLRFRDGSGCTLHSGFQGWDQVLQIASFTERLPRRWEPAFTTHNDRRLVAGATHAACLISVVFFQVNIMTTPTASPAAGSLPL